MYHIVILETKIIKIWPWHVKQTISLQILQRLSSTNFTWSILEYFAPYVLLEGLTNLDREVSSENLWKLAFKKTIFK